MSEYGAGAGVTLHADEPKPLDHSEEYQCLFHEHYWRALGDRPWLWCKAVWQMFDAAAAGRDEGDTPGINDKGLVTRDRQTKKDAFFWYRACWSDEAVVHVTGRRARQRAQRTDVELYVNGSTRGVARVVERVALFFDVALDAGEDRIEVEGRRAAATVRDECRWTVL
jgi:beta-galactosidase